MLVEAVVVRDSRRGQGAEQADAAFRKADAVASCNQAHIANDQYLQVFGSCTEPEHLPVPGDEAMFRSAART